MTVTRRNAVVFSDLVASKSSTITQNLCLVNMKSFGRALIFELDADIYAKEYAHMRSLHSQQNF